MTKGYPQRPRQGGSDLAAAWDSIYQKGGWIFQPKVNGWRALLNLRTRAMLNRHGQPLSVARDFEAAITELQLRALEVPFDVGEWVDVEAMGRRHAVGRGSLAILDLPEVAANQFERSTLALQLAPPLDMLGAMFSGSRHLLVYSMPVWDERRALDMTTDHGRLGMWWALMPRLNKHAGCTLYEGVVAKRADAAYRWGRTPQDESPHWTKHRFTTQ